MSQKCLPEADIGSQSVERMPRHPSGPIAGIPLQNVLIFEFDVLHCELWRFAGIRELGENAIDPRRVRPLISCKVNLQGHLREFIGPRYPWRHPSASRNHFVVFNSSSRHVLSSGSSLSTPATSQRKNGMPKTPLGMRI